ncbi:C2 family cysteine protease [Microcoleus sp. F10-C6]|uniref:C2 family cysteine protease n=1 Tax=unclassified Microcoleus TaxID=2642155 RepID=UPI002FD60B3B
MIEIIGQNTPEILTGTVGADTIYGLGGNDTISGFESNDLLFGNLGLDSILGGSGEDSLYGGKEDDFLLGGDGNDFLRGDNDRDDVRGEAGDDLIFGGKQSDRLFGDEGNDILSGDLGPDILTGGAGADQFVLRQNGEGRDEITDFQDGIDTIKLPDELTFNDILLKPEGNNKVIITAKTTGEELALLDNVPIGTITAEDFGQQGTNETGLVSLDDDSRPDESDFSLPTIFANTSLEGSLDINTDKDNSLRPGSLADDFGLLGITANQTVKINLNSSAFNPYLQIIDAVTGELIAANDDATNDSQNSEITFKAKLGVDYRIRATNAQGGSVGNYILSASTSDPIIGDLAPGKTINGSLSLDDLYSPERLGSLTDNYRLTALTVGQQVQINLTSPNFNSYLQLVNAATGEILGENDDSTVTSTNSQLNFTVQSGVEYIVRATSSDANVTGNYVLSAATNAQQTIALDQTVNGIIDGTDKLNPLTANSFVDDYLLTGTNVGQKARINLSSNQFDTYLQLVNSDTGQIISENDNTNLEIGNFNSELSFTVQPGVNYLLRVTTLANTGGSYTLTTTNESGDWISTNLADQGLQNVTRQQSNDGILDRRDMLAIFTEAGNDDGIVDSRELNDIRKINNNGSRFRMPGDVNYLSNQVVKRTAPNTQATQLQATTAIFFVGNCELGIPPAEYTEKEGKKITKFNFDYVPLNSPLFGDTDANPSYGEKGTPQIGHIDQGKFGDCFLLAALGAMFKGQREETGKTSSIIQNLIKEDGVGAYKVSFYKSPGKRESVSIDNCVVVDKTRPKSEDLGSNLFGANADAHDTLGNPGTNFTSGRWTNNPYKWPIWVPLVERAYATWQQLEKGGNGWDILGNGGYQTETLFQITGFPVTEYNNGKRNSGLGADTLSFDIVKAAIDTPNSYIAASTGGASKKKGLAQNSKLISGHVYSVTDAYVTANLEQRVVVRNPWGQDNYEKYMNEKITKDGKEVNNPEYKPDSFTEDKWDGFIDLSYDEFRRGFGTVSIAKGPAVIAKPVIIRLS